METQSLQLNNMLALQGEKTNTPSSALQNQAQLANANTYSSELKVNESSSNAELSPDKLEKVAQQLQNFMGEMNRSIQFKVDEDSGRNVIKVIDKESGDLVKQYPSEEVLGIVSKLAEATGVLVDFKV
ncbi:flagellar protein FlaG [Pseudoalteromonas sp. SWXJ133]|uniref:flagellar protein FlaG n=1 Tax=unclassified Pseudoalteromonas TaxID=194690 RepID=UPI00140AD3AB|nr:MULTISPECIES: flagellar protein FlaG [unclassified Pseudoalteromonas]MBH0020587.1 flagellar protein FlaG [Pseudoalteromonas sp. SWXJ133]